MQIRIFLFLLITLVGVVTAQRPPNLNQLREICGNVDLQTCQSRARPCINLRRLAEDANSLRDNILGCGQKYGVTPAMVIRAFQVAQASQEGEILDYLPVEQNVIINIRRCTFIRGGLADANGKVDPLAIRTRLANKFRSLLADNGHFLQIMLKAVDSCPVPSVIERAREFRSCIARACIQNYP